MWDIGLSQLTSSDFILNHGAGFYKLSDLVFEKGPKSGKKGRSVLVLGNADGEIVIFYDANDVTKRFQDIFSDPAIFKIQYGIEIDVGLLPFKVQGLVDCG